MSAVLLLLLGRLPRSAVAWLHLYLDVPVRVSDRAVQLRGERSVVQFTGWIPDRSRQRCGLRDG